MPGLNVLWSLVQYSFSDRKRLEIEASYEHYRSKLIERVDDTAISYRCYAAIESLPEQLSGSIIDRLYAMKLLRTAQDLMIKDIEAYCLFLQQKVAGLSKYSESVATCLRQTGVLTVPLALSREMVERASRFEELGEYTKAGNCYAVVAGLIG